MIADSQTAEALLAYICTHPADDVPRLAYADVLEERGEDARAELIRVQCELARDFDRYEFAPRSLPLRQRERELLTPVRIAEWFPIAGPFSVQTAWRRGFPAEVSLTAEAFAGGPCGRCQGQGGELLYAETCGDCHGTGRTPGHAALFRMAPIERVALDREPGDALRPGQWWWWRWEPGSHPAERTSCDLPAVLFSLLEGGTQPPYTAGRRYDTEQAAHDALAAAALLYGRRRGWPCPECKGTGTRREYCAAGGETIQPYERCPACHGTGHTVSA